MSLSVDDKQAGLGSGHPSELLGTPLFHPFRQQQARRPSFCVKAILI